MVSRKLDSVLPKELGAQSSGVTLISGGKIFITGGDASPATWEIYTPNGTTVTLSNHGGLFDTRGGGHTVTHF